MSTNVLVVSSQLLKRALLFTIFVVVAGIGVNWIFVGIYGGQIWSYDRWIGGGGGKVVSILVMLLFVVVFPFLYLMQVKLLVITRSLATIWQQYRNELMEVIVDRAVETTLLLQQRGKNMISSSHQWFAHLPMLLRCLLDYLKKYIPFVDQIETSLQDIDWTQQHTKEEVSGHVMAKLEKNIEASSLPLDSSFIWWLVGANGVVMVGVLIIIML